MITRVIGAVTGKREMGVEKTPLSYRIGILPDRQERKEILRRRKSMEARQ